MKPVVLLKVTGWSPWPTRKKTNSTSCHGNDSRSTMPMHRITTTNLWLNIASSRRDGVAIGPDFSPQEWFYFNGKYRRHSSLQQYRG